MINYYFFILLFLSFSLLSAQEKLTKEERVRREKNIKAGNPFVKYGCKAPVATLSKGKYLEVHDLDSIVIIGTTRWHVYKKIIVGEIKIDSLNLDAQPTGDVPGMWMSPDPLSEEYPSWNPYSFCFDNPVHFVDPDGREPTPAQAARMAAQVYGDKVLLTGGWRVSKRDFGLSKTDLNNSATGLKSQIYERTVKGKTEYTYATAGTELSLKDVFADVKQPLGLSKQYEKAADNAKVISNVLGMTELTFTGHSLGGGEAALNALVTDRNAITFNPAGVSDITKFAEGTWKTPFKSENKINTYIMITDPLNALQNTSPLIPNASGNLHYLVPTDCSSIFNGHSINNVLKNFNGKE